jgi:hypothetical protein
MTVDYGQDTNQLTDGAGNAMASVGDALSVTVTNDTTVPTVSAVSSTAAAATYNLGDVIPVTIQFSEAVTVTGTPQLTLETGSVDRTASYASGSGTNTLTFNYTVQAGDTSTDLGYTSASALALNSGTIKDAAGNNATLTLASPGTAGSLGANEDLVIDGVVPTITAQAATAGTKTVTLTMSEAVTGTPAVGDFAVLMNSATNTVTNVSASGTTATLTLTNAIPNNATLTVDYTQGTNQLTDGAGNAMASVGDALMVTVTNDTTVPTVSSVSSTADDGTYSVGATIPVTIQFSEAVTVTGTPQLTLETGSVDRTASYASGSGTNTLTFNYTVQTGDATADLGYASTSALALNNGTIKDAAGNNATLTLPSPGATGSLSNAKDIVIVAKAISYSTVTFVEAAANDGSIYTTATLTLSGDTFTGTIGNSLNSAVSYANVPTGLSANLTKTSDTTATLQLTSTAGAHADANDISSLTVTLGNAAFTNSNASQVTGASRSDLSINFADSGLILSGTADANVIIRESGKYIIYGNGGPDVINGGAGSDTIDITDSGATELNSATIVMTSVGHGLDTVIGFKGGAISSGGDVLDFTAIAPTDSVATGLTTSSNFGANNVFVFNSTQVSITDAAAAIANDDDVTATTGYIVIADSNNSGRVTVFHSTDLAVDGTETALVVLSGINIASLTAENFLI